MKRAVVNVAVGGYRSPGGDYYPQSQARLRTTLDTLGQYQGDKEFWTNTYPSGSEPHHVLPYHFKPMAMEQAAARGHRVLLWLDAVMVVLKPIEPVLRQIEEQGYILWSHPLAEWTVGAWTSDACLRYYNVNRGDAFSMEMICSAVFGWSLDHPVGKKLHDEFIVAPAAALRGSKHNRNRIVAADPRVQGHRHDQSVLSILAHRMGLKGSPTPAPISCLGFESERTVLLHDPTGRN